MHSKMWVMHLDWKNWSGVWRCQLWLYVHGLVVTQQHHSSARSNTREQKHWTMALIEVTFSWLWVPTVCEIIMQWAQSTISYAKLTTLKFKHCNEHVWITNVKFYSIQSKITYLSLWLSPLQLRMYAQTYDAPLLVGWGGNSLRLPLTMSWYFMCTL